MVRVLSPDWLLLFSFSVQETRAKPKNIMASRLDNFFIEIFFKIVNKIIDKNCLNSELKSVAIDTSQIT